MKCPVEIASGQADIGQKVVVELGQRVHGAPIVPMADRSANEPTKAGQPRAEFAKNRMSLCFHDRISFGENPVPPPYPLGALHPLQDHELQVG